MDVFENGACTRIKGDNVTVVLRSIACSVSGIPLFAFPLLLPLTRTRSRIKVNFGGWVPTRLCRICIKMMQRSGLDLTLPPKTRSGMGSPDWNVSMFEIHIRKLLDLPE